MPHHDADSFPAPHGSRPAASASGPEEVTARRRPGEPLGPDRMTDPLHHPAHAGPVTRTKRAWVLLLLTTLLPGSAQLVAGNRTLGRRALAVTLAGWVLALLALLTWLVHRSWLIGLVTGRVTTLVLIGALVVLAAGWLVLFADTLRIVRPRLLARGMRPIVVLGCVVLAVLTCGGLGYSAWLVHVGRGALGGIFADGRPFDPVDGRYNFLLMGGDAGSDRVGRRPDSMTVLSVDAKTGQAVTISLPRNTQNAVFRQGSPLWSVYPDGYSCGDECILNALYPEVANEHADLYPGAKDPGAEAMKDAAEGITGLPIQAYVLVDMDGFAKLVDALGGIDLDVGGRVPIGGGHDQFTGAANPIDGYIEPGRQHLDGFHALWYGRSREGASDYDREARQRCVQAAILKQISPATVLTKAQELSDAGQQVVETDIPQQQLGSFVDLGLDAQSKPLVPYGMAPPYFEETFPTYPDFDRFHAGVAQTIRDAENGATTGPTAAARAEAESAHGSGTVLGASTTLALATRQAAVRAQPVAEDAAQDSGTQPRLSPNGTCSVP